MGTVEEGFPFRPIPFELARILADWRPANDAIADLDIPSSPDFDIAPRGATPSRTNRLDLADQAAWKYRTVWGFVTRIDETRADNTVTPFRIEVLRRFVFRADSHSINTVSSIYVRIQAYSSNLMVTDPCESPAISFSPRLQ